MWPPGLALVPHATSRQNLDQAAIINL